MHVEHGMSDLATKGWQGSYLGCILASLRLNYIRRMPSCLLVSFNDRPVLIWVPVSIFLAGLNNISFTG